MATIATGRSVGIEKMHAYPCTLSLDLASLALARGLEPSYAWDTVWGRTRSVNPTWEDPVTMAVNAARSMLTEQDLRDIELVVFGTESSPDQGKPLSTFVVRHLGVGENCRNFECKHACYGGTSALMMAAHWIASGVAPGKKALVVCADQSRMNLGVKWEFVMGAGAVAMLVSDQPDVVKLDLEGNGYWTEEVGDTFRPTSTEEAGNTENSLYCYLDGLNGAFRHFAAKNPGVSFDRDFAGHVYHMPFSAMSRRAHRTTLRSSGHRNGFQPHFDEKVEPGTRVASRVGGTYTASTFLALMSLVEHSDHLRANDRVTIFSYGSGSCAEFYSARIGRAARERVRQSKLSAALDARTPLSVEEYEAIERERTAAIDRADWLPTLEPDNAIYEHHYAGRGKLIYRGVKAHFRQYEWS